MDDKAQVAAEQIGQTASQLHDLAVQADLPFLAHLLGMVMLEAQKPSALRVAWEMMAQMQ